MEAPCDALFLIEQEPDIFEIELTCEFLLLLRHDEGLDVEVDNLIKGYVVVDGSRYGGVAVLGVDFDGTDRVGIEVGDQDREIVLAQGLRDRAALQQLAAGHVHIVQGLLELAVFLLDAHGAAQDARLVEIEVEHRAVDHGRASDVLHVEEGLCEHRGRHVGDDKHREAKVEVGVQTLLAHHHEQHEHVYDDDEDGQHAQRSALEGVGGVVGVDDVGKEHRDGGKRIDGHGEKEQEILRLGALYGREHEDEQHEDKRAHDVARGAADVAPDGMDAHVAEPDLEVCDTELERLGREDHVEDPARARVKHPVAQVQQEQEAQSGDGRQVADPELVESHAGPFSCDGGLSINLDGAVL